MRRFLAAIALLSFITVLTGLSSCAQTAAPKAAPGGPLAQAIGDANPATHPSTTRPVGSRPVIPTQKELAEAARLNQKIYDLFKNGKFSEAKTLLEQLNEKDPLNNLNWYNLACANCRLGNSAEAIKCLNSAVDTGFCDFQHLRRDEDLAAIRATAEFKKILAEENECQTKRAERILAGLKRQFGEDYIRELDNENKLVVATNVDRETLENLKARLKQQADALWRDLFTHKFEQYVTVLISKTDSSQMNGVGGVYNHAQRLLQAKTVGMTVTHEFTHALHMADQDGLGQQHPIWVVEGLATLCESSTIEGGHLVPQANHRLNYLQQLVAQKKTIPWADFFKYDQAKFMAKPFISYPQCRYIFMYLYSNGKLKKWYDLYTANYKTDPTGVKAMELVFDKKLADIEANWLRWVASAKAPPMGLPPGHACLGLRVEPETDGVQVIEIVPGSGSDKAGLKVGDVIVKIDGRDTIEPDDLIMLVSGHKVNDKLDVRFRRGTEYSDLRVTLGAMPGPTAKPTPATTPKPQPKKENAQAQPQAMKEAA